MNKKITAILDLTDCKYILDFHKRAKDSLQFPDYYGYNWSAFWDSLSVDSPIEYVIIRGSNTISKELQPCFKEMIRIFEKCKEHHNKFGWYFDYIIES